MQSNTRGVRKQLVKVSPEYCCQCFRFMWSKEKKNELLNKIIFKTLTFSVSLSLPLSIWHTGSNQHYVRFWGSNPELPGGKRVNLPGRLCRQSGDVDRVSSVTGGGSHSGSCLASGNPTHALNSCRLCTNWQPCRVLCHQ